MTLQCGCATAITFWTLCPALPDCTMLQRDGVDGEVLNNFPVFLGQTLPYMWHGPSITGAALMMGACSTCSTAKYDRIRSVRHGTLCLPASAYFKAFYLSAASDFNVLFLDGPPICC